ncbi:hypothetical protein X767_04675 [Mesorhizobium sp. LSJC264A00]|nr:hypothetical protein X767_04675 [Mesorhizobium sp. LSJC264A00]
MAARQCRLVAQRPAPDRYLLIDGQVAAFWA